MTNFKNTYWWNDSVPSVDIYNNTLNSNLKIAYLGGMRAYQGLKYECDLQLLTEKNWKYILTYARPDMVLVESCLISCTGEFRNVLIGHGTDKTIFDEIVMHARKFKIPVIFWQTMDSRYDKLFYVSAKKCDLKYYSDRSSLEYGRKQGFRGDVLLPCIQPKIHNRFYEGSKVAEYNVLFDGWKDIIWHDEVKTALLEIQSLGLHIIDSKFRQWSKRAAYVGRLKSSLRGCVPGDMLWKILRFCKTQVFISVNQFLSMDQEYGALQAIASGCHVFCLGKPCAESLMSDYVVFVKNKRALLEGLRYSLDNELSRLRSVQPLWRAVHANHTYAHRLATICGDVGIAHGWNEFPVVSGITASNRPYLLDQLLSVGVKQTYPRFEHVIVLNSDNVDINKLQKKEGIHKFYYMPEDQNIGSCLNVAKANASGEYITKIDDDDLYGSNYIYDMILNLRSADLDFFGKKPNGAIYIESEDVSGLRSNDYKQCNIVHEGNFKNFLISGCSLSFSKYISDNCFFSEDAVGVVDTEFHNDAYARSNKIGHLDLFNLIVYRRKDLSSHNWRDEILGKNLFDKIRGIGLEMFFSEEKLSYSLKHPKINLKQNSGECAVTSDRLLENLDFDKNQVQNSRSRNDCPIESGIDLSIIIPLYNKEEFIEKCLFSVLSEENIKIEVICVDDMSTDNGSVIVEKIALMDNRVQLVRHSSNSGASVARNSGISVAKGRYLFFLDADDVIAQNSLSKMLMIADECNSDVVRGKITGLSANGSLYKLAAEHLLHTENKSSTFWKDEESLWYYWYFSANLYRRSFLINNRINFPVGIRNEDPFFLCRCFLASSRITLLNEIVYYYRIGGEQKNKTPSLSFLNGWSLGNYYLSQLFSQQCLQYSYFLNHFSSLLPHSKNAVKYLDKENSLSILKYIQLMFKRSNIGYFEDVSKQPWTRKKNFVEEDVNYVRLLKYNKVNEIYLYLRDN